MDKKNEILAVVKETPKPAILAEAGELVFKDFKSFKADMLAPIADDSAPDGDDLYTKSEVNDMMGQMYSMLCSYMGDIYNSMRQGDRSIACQTSNYIDSHNGGHLPNLHPGQVKAILTSAGIADDFVSKKEPMIPENDSSIYASFKDIKFNVK